MNPMVEFLIRSGRVEAPAGFEHLANTHVDPAKVTVVVVDEGHHILAAEPVAPWVAAHHNADVESIRCDVRAAAMIAKNRHLDATLPTWRSLPVTLEPRI